MKLTLSALQVEIAGRAAPVLEISHLVLPSGAQLAISGASGSGKTTFLHAICGLLNGRAGSVFWDDTDLHALSPPDRDRWRGNHIGLIMQDFHLIAGLSALDNVLLPQAIRQFPRSSRSLAASARALLAELGIQNPDQRTASHSRGEMQRIAIARALLMAPPIIIADEPTASLDAENGAAITALLTQLARERGATLICVTHDPALKNALAEQLILEHGQMLTTTLINKE